MIIHVEPLIRPTNLPPFPIVRNSRTQLQSSGLSSLFSTMQYKILRAFVVSVVGLVVTAAPVPNSSNGIHILDRDRDISNAPLVGMSDVAREVVPEARACRLYACL
ncbi:hypothetical protein DFH07DRAFT_1054397 [Mycena maculata]|uniref:Uncharacterized protein n=1 Tax=Mycena maculata TaxID=230809 RepID=A0AAD7KFY1_9AGAR|nr:hypothetical protein DFH07DRAFT_1054397 [Mycena maculata]